MFDVKICSSSRTEVSRNAVLNLKQVENVTVQFNSLKQLLLHRQNQNIWKKLFLPFFNALYVEVRKMFVCFAHWLTHCFPKEDAIWFLVLFCFFNECIFLLWSTVTKGVYNRERLAAKQQPETIKCQWNSAACSDDAIMSQRNKCKKGGY